MEKIDELNRLYAELLRRGTVHNKTQLCEKTGINKSNLSAAFGGNPKYLTDNLLARIASLLSSDTPEESAFRVPLIPIEAHAGSLTGFSDSVNDYDCEQIVSPVRGASFAIQVTGESMAPAYPSGARILCQRIDEAAFIEWGKVYLLDTVNGAVLKQVRKSDNPDRIVCHSLNPSPEFSPFEVEMRHINAWFRVLMIMSLV
jgi:phage repressor protein C with HTH and peptisase S24 domain